VSAILTRRPGILTRRPGLILPRSMRGGMSGLVRGPHLHPIPGILASGQMSAPAPGGGGYGFAPSDLANLLIWWRTDALDNVIHFDGFNNVFTTFTDQSGNGNNGTWDGARATVTPSGTGSLTTGTASSFGATYILPSGCMTGVTSAQIFMVLQQAADPPGDIGVSGLWYFSPQNGINSHYPYVDGVIYDGWSSNTRFTTGNPSVSLTTWHRLCVKGEASGYEMWLNGVSHYSNGTSCGSDWQTVPRFGVSGPSFYGWRGNILEMIVYSDVKNSTDRGLVDQYLADRISGVWYAAENP
jgi:hypothetical protein